MTFLAFSAYRGSAITWLKGAVFVVAAPAAFSAARFMVKPLMISTWPSASDEQVESLASGKMRKIQYVGATFHPQPLRT